MNHSRLDLVAQSHVSLVSDSRFAEGNEGNNMSTHSVCSEVCVLRHDLQGKGSNHNVACLEGHSMGPLFPTLDIPVTPSVCGFFH